MLANQLFGDQPDQNFTGLEENVLCGSNLASFSNSNMINLGVGIESSKRKQNILRFKDD